MLRWVLSIGLFAVIAATGLSRVSAGRQDPDAVTDGQWLLSVPGTWTTDRAGR